MTYKTRRRLALAILVLGLPVYIVLAATLVGLFERPPVMLELAIYLGLGILWALPCRRVFLGIGKPDPDARGRDERGAG
ncbi:MAG: DUF2842 domain-containing protein [Thermohalobaculum sp.]|nr:DUF2842 domain-containing protein [Thermohalobaculum sp.]